jgi:hypothetical protein
MKTFALLIAFFAFVFLTHAEGPLLIKDGKLQSDLNAGGHAITNATDLIDTNGNSLFGAGTGGGEANDGLNIGSGVGLYAGKSGVHLQLRDVATAGGATASTNANTLTISADAAGAAAAVDATHGLVFQQFSAATNLWPSNWVSDSGHQMFRMPGFAGGLLTPLVVTNFGTTNFGLGAPIGTNYDQAVTGPPFIYLSVSNSPAFDVAGMNIKTVTLSTGTNFEDWGVIFIIAPHTLVTSDAKLNLNSNYLHIGISLAVNPGIGIVFGTNTSIQGTGYGASIPQSILDTMGGTNGSVHNVEVRRLKSDTMTIAIDGATCMTIVDTNLPLFWGSNVVWEFTGFDAIGQRPDFDRSRTFVQRVYNARLDNAYREKAPTYSLDSSQFSVNDKVASIANGATILGSIHPTNQVVLGTGVGGGALSFDPAWGAIRASASLGFISTGLKIQGSASVDNGLSVGNADGSGITLGLFSTPFASPGTNSLTISGVALRLGSPTNNTPAFSDPNGSLTSTTNGDVYIEKAGTQTRLATMIDVSSSGGGSVTSVGISVPQGFFVSGSPVTTSGTLTIARNGGDDNYLGGGATNLNKTWTTNLEVDTMTGVSGGTIEQKNGTTRQSFNLYQSFTDASNYKRLSSWFDSSGNYFTTAEGSGTGTNTGDWYFKITGGHSLRFWTRELERWRIGNDGVLDAGLDNAYDIGQNNRPRTIYAGTSVVSPLFSGSAAGLTNYADTNIVVSTNNWNWPGPTNNLDWARGTLQRYQPTDTTPLAITNFLNFPVGQAASLVMWIANTNTAALNVKLPSPCETTNSLGGLTVSVNASNRLQILFQWSPLSTNALFSDQQLIK